MTRVTIGIGGYLGHDANAALVVDGQLVAASQEERFSRAKHDGTFPRLAIQDCLDRANLPPEAVTDVVFAEKPVQSRLFALAQRPGNWMTRALGMVVPERLSGPYTRAAREVFALAKFHFAWHHSAHVAGAFHTSKLERAAFLCVDGNGEDACASAGTISAGEIKFRWQQPYENGLGLFYTLVTNYLGFLPFGSEYKVMGLAPFGRPVFVENLARLFVTDSRGGLRLRAPVDFTWASRRSALASVAEATGVPVRNVHDPLTESHADLAASLQWIFEDEVLKMARFLQRETGEESLVFCGGCAQNCVAAGKLRAAGVFASVHNSPVGGDMGTGLGAALLLEGSGRGQALKVDPVGYCLGSEPGSIPDAAMAYRVQVVGDIHAFVAKEIAAGKVVGWVRGRMELGARALGARSILADPRQPQMQSDLNLKVKFRESFRPFAPAILAEHVSEWFDSGEASDYMNFTANLLPALRVEPPAGLAGFRERLNHPRCAIPSVVHVDFSARLQTVRKDVHPDLHLLLTEFNAITGVPILINTSFNVSGQPIVRTAAEAWECFVNTDIDLLVVNDEVFRNPCNRTRDEKLAWRARFSESA